MLRDGVKLLITEKEYIANDLISEKDFNTFQDILHFCKPIEVLPNTFGIIFDIESGFKFKTTNTYSKEELRALVFPVLDLMMNQSNKFYNKKLVLAYRDKVSYTLDRLSKAKRT